MNHEELWIKTLAQIEVKIDSPAQFKTWFKDTRLVDIEGKYAVIEVRNPYTSDWLKNRHEKMITDTISYVAGKPLAIKFKVNGANYEPNLANEETGEFEETPLLSTIGGSPDLTTQIESAGINRKYTLSRYIEGTSNRMAYAAAKAVVEKPGEIYNPLFIYGPAGVGKTHLAQGIGIGLIERNPNRKVVYSASEGFLNDMVKSIREGKNLEFRQKYRRIDCLIIDDIQYISTWEKTQDELFNTFNELYNANKQIILISDRKPEDIPNIDARLRTRFMGGLAVDIDRPDYAMRIAIVENKLKEKNLDIPVQIVEYLVKAIPDNIRELEGAVQKVALFQDMKHDRQPLTINEVARIVEQDPESKRKQTNFNQVLKIVAKEFQVSVKDLKGDRRTANIALARQVAMYLLREEFAYKLEKIAQILQRKDHTTVIHGLDKITSMMTLSTGFSDQILRIKENIRNEE